MPLRDTVERLRHARVEPNDPVYNADRWRDDVTQLYRNISEWLAPFIEDGGIVLKQHSKTVFEESIGSYEIDQLDIEVGDETVRLDPRGAIVIGARGRIDMSHLGTGDPLLLVLTGTADQSHWAIVNRSVRTKLTALTKDSFESALESLVEQYATSSEPSM